MTVKQILKKVRLLFFQYWTSLFFLSLGISSIAIDVLDDESDEEVPQAIPLYPNADGISLFYKAILFLRVKIAFLLSAL
jgi:hypothetical protein